jgi:hypothetical protein
MPRKLEMANAHMTETDMAIFRICCQLRDNAAALGMAETKIADLQAENAELRKRLDSPDADGKPARAK